MKKRIMFSIVSLALVCTYANAQNNMTTPGVNDTTKNKKSATGTSTKSHSGTTKVPQKPDEGFVSEASKGGILEVHMGNVGKEKATNSRVKDFSDMILRDHTRANEELKSIAVKKKIRLPVPDNKDLHKMDHLSGAEFDKHFMDMMVNDHKKAVHLFEKESNTGKDAELKAFAAKILPTLKMHLDSAQAIQTDLNNKVEMGSIQQK